jgi:hypothetical protein
MSTSEILKQIDQLAPEEQKKIFVYLTKKVVGEHNGNPKPWLNKSLSFEEACEVVFRENRELLKLLAK